MKTILKVAVVGLAFTASGAFAQGIFHRSPQTAGRTYTESTFWQPVQNPQPAVNQSATGASATTAPGGAPGQPVPTDSALLSAPGPTSGPYTRGDDIRNASSALWGVGG